MGYFVVGVYLDAQVLMGVDELDEQRKLAAEALVVRLSHERWAQCGHYFVERLAVEGTSADDGLAAGHARQFPALADALRGIGELFELCNLISAPQRLFEQGLEG